MNAMLELAERCEAAEGADRELDALIFCAFNPPHQAYFSEGDQYFPAQWMVCEGGNHHAPDLYTASLDAAMSLVPEEYRRADHVWPDASGAFRTYLWGAENKIMASGAGATPALALCAAALRARASS